MNDDEHYCSQCGRPEHQCKCDWPMPKPPPYPADDGGYSTPSDEEWKKHQ